MKLAYVISLISLSLLAGFAQAAEHEARQIDGTLLVNEGVPTEGLSRKGEGGELTGTQKPLLTYTTEGLTFEYSSDMKVESETGLDIQTVTAETENSTLFIGQVLPYELTSEEAVNDTLKRMTRQFQSFGATFPQNRRSTSRRTIGGKETIGEKLKFSLGHLRHETEAYSFQRAGKTIILIFQADHEDREEAETYFKTIAESIR